MIGKQESSDHGTKNVSTKVPAWVADLLNIICRARGTDLYGLLQLVLQFIVETAKVSGPVPPQMQTLLNMLKMDADWNKAFSFANPSACMDIAQVILILQQNNGKEPRQGFGLVMIDKAALPGQTPKMTTCVDDILERVAEVSMKGLYKQLRCIGGLMESDSLRETLTMLCDAQTIAELDRIDQEEMPGYDNRHDYGRIIEYGQRNRRIKHRTPDSLANSQQRIVFTEEDQELSDIEAGVSTDDATPIDDLDALFGCRPFDQEP